MVVHQFRLDMWIVIKSHILETHNKACSSKRIYSYKIVTSWWKYAKGYSDLWKYNVTFGVLEQENEAVHVSFANEYFLKRDGTNWMGHHLHASRFRVSGILEKTKMLLIYERLNRKRKF